MRHIAGLGDAALPSRAVARGAPRRLRVGTRRLGVARALSGGRQGLRTGRRAEPPLGRGALALDRDRRAPAHRRDHPDARAARHSRDRAAPHARALRDRAAGCDPGDHPGTRAARPRHGGAARRPAPGRARGDGPQAGERARAGRGARAPGQREPHEDHCRRLHAHAVGARGRGARPDRAGGDREAADQPARREDDARLPLARRAADPGGRRAGVARQQARPRGRRRASGDPRGGGIAGPAGDLGRRRSRRPRRRSRGSGPPGRRQGGWRPVPDVSP